MSANNTDDMALGNLLNDEDLALLEELAKQRGLTVAELAKKGIQDTITKRTRPRSMPGTVQPFRRREKD
ncbi:hypothetical protein [Stutzerimonas stutzeri]|uniref:hypothetical protein n=1 Tax=Stutzerimonas stutzeri TaxID=316 RepID=UPI00220EF775|nr:hypothetical protein [Stutzerimonas stutzeri]UVO19571.1 hypothetical protein KN217_07675 [Stutzerimonas stutzeri]